MLDSKTIWRSLRTLRCIAKRHQRSNISQAQIRTLSTTVLKPKVSEPLRIMFCGSDDFSVASLRALHAEQQRKPDEILSIDVLTRPGKFTGRGLKHYKEGPLRATAKELGLNFHERDTFTGWELPLVDGQPINLLVAVSFGLFVPPRILNNIKYGGINLHPSLLPNFRGPAPLQHTIMTGSSVTGVTLQTLDEKSFDAGKILLQTPQSQSRIPDPKTCTYDTLLDHVTPMAAELLVKGIQKRVFVAPIVETGWYKATKIRHARKLDTLDREVQWDSGSRNIERRYRALGRLWTNVHKDFNVAHRVLFEDIELVPIPKVLSEWISEKKYKVDANQIEHHLDPLVRFLVISEANNPMTMPQRAIPYILDGTAIILYIDKWSAIRVSNITRGGGGTKAAARVDKIFEDRKLWKLFKCRPFEVAAVKKTRNWRKVQTDFTPAPLGHGNVPRRVIGTLL